MGLRVPFALVPFGFNSQIKFIIYIVSRAFSKMEEGKGPASAISLIHIIQNRGEKITSKTSNT